MCYPFWAIEDPITRSQKRVNLDFASLNGGDETRVTPFETGVIGFSAYQRAHFRITSDNLVVVGTHSWGTPCLPFEPVLIVLPLVSLRIRNGSPLPPTLAQRNRSRGINSPRFSLPNYRHLIFLPSPRVWMPISTEHLDRDRGI